MIKNKIAIVDLMGGFGNQLFQLSYAEYLKKNNFEVFINMNNFKSVKKEVDSVITNRDLVIPIEFFGHSEVKDKEFYKYSIIDKLNLHKNPLIKSNGKFKKFFAWFNEDNIEEIREAKNNRYTGYWQDLEIVMENREYLIESVSKDSTINKALSSSKIQGSTVVHVRRTDYVKLGENLSIDFYKNCIRFGEQNIKNFHYEVFTDDTEWVNSKNLFKSATKIHDFIDTPSGTLDSFSKMLEKENFIIGNSTFSFMAALLSEQPPSKILYANPWFKNVPFKIEAKSNWIPFENK